MGGGVGSWVAGWGGVCVCVEWEERRRRLICVCGRYFVLDCHWGLCWNYHRHTFVRPLQQCLALSLETLVVILVFVVVAVGLLEMCCYVIAKAGLGIIFGMFSKG